MMMLLLLGIQLFLPISVIWSLSGLGDPQCSDSCFERLKVRAIFASILISRHLTYSQRKVSVFLISDIKLYRIPPILTLFFFSWFFGILGWIHFGFLEGYYLIKWICAGMWVCQCIMWRSCVCWASPSLPCSTSTPTPPSSSSQCSSSFVQPAHSASSSCQRYFLLSFSHI